MHSPEALTDSLIRDGYLKSLSLIEVFRATDRARFVPEEVRAEAYRNLPLPIGEGQTISQPLVVAMMLELLAPAAGHKVLEVGTGSGWQTAMLAKLVAAPPASGGRVASIERIRALAEAARETLTRELAPEIFGAVLLRHADGREGFLEGAPYDRIIAAASGNAMPEIWKSQLAVGGRIVAPVGEDLVVLDKTAPEEFTERRFHGFKFVPLVEGFV